MRDKATRCTVPSGKPGRSTLPVKWISGPMIKRNNEKKNHSARSLRCTSNMDLLGQLWRREGGGRMVIICKTSAQVRIPLHLVNTVPTAHRDIVQRVAGLSILTQITSILQASVSSFLFLESNKRFRNQKVLISIIGALVSIVLNK